VEEGVHLLVFDEFFAVGPGPARTIPSPVLIQ